MHMTHMYLQQRVQARDHGLLPELQGQAAGGGHCGPDPDPDPCLDAGGHRAVQLRRGRAVGGAGQRRLEQGCRGGLVLCAGLPTTIKGVGREVCHAYVYVYIRDHKARVAGAYLDLGGGGAGGGQQVGRRVAGGLRDRPGQRPAVAGVLRVRDGCEWNEKDDVHDGWEM